MVTRHYGIVLFAWLLTFVLQALVYSSPVLAQSNSLARLDIETDKTELETGKSLLVKVIYIGTSIPQSAQFQSWNNDFYIADRTIDTEHLPQGLIKTTQKLRLYPRKTGTLVLHAIAQGGAIAKPVRIKVRPVIRNAIDGTPVWLNTPNSMWQGETLLLTAEMQLMSESNQVKTAEPRFPGFHLIKSWQTRVIKEGISRVRFYWLIKAHHYGYFTLEAPAIIQRGKGRWRFFLPEIKLQVKPVPSYIPPTVPVAKLNTKAEVIHKHQQAFWQISLSSKGELPEEIYGLKVQLAKLAKTSVSKILVSSEEVLSDDVMLFKQNYLLPVPEWFTGFNKASVSIVYFNPQTSQLNQLQVVLPSVWNIPETGQYMFMSVFIIFITVIAMRLYQWIKAYRQKQNFLKSISNCQTADQLRLLLLRNSHAMTLSQIAQRTNHAKLDEALKHLNHNCFAAEKIHSLSRIKHDIIKNYVTIQ